MSINLEELVGMSERSAVRKIENSRYLARVISRDGVENLPVSEEISNDRVNLKVASGEVTEAWVG